MPSKGKKPTVWVVMHYEFMRSKREVVVDSMQFHVSSSRRKAEEFIRKGSVDSWSWWQIHPHVVDDDDWWHEGAEVYYYSYRGRPLLYAPFRQAMKAYEKEQARIKAEQRKGRATR